MNKNIRPRRSVLYMPGSNTRALDKARNLPADALIMDLEDAVAADAKPAARDNVIAAVRTGGYGHREIAIRVNGLDTPWGADDIAAVAGCAADAVVFPKISSANQLTDAVQLLNSHGAPDSMKVWVMAETAPGILNIAEIAAFGPPLEVIVMGTSDLAKELRLPPDSGRNGLIYTLSHCLLAARARGLDILDGIHGDLSDTGGFNKACQHGRSLGFDGKTLIHPGQIDAANEVFGISEAQMKQAAEIITAWDAAAAKGRGIAVVNGRMIEKLHADDARRVLALGASIQRQGEE
jgi:citrate lyase subunit beta/citryl-CoA lyase